MMRDLHFYRLFFIQRDSRIGFLVGLKAEFLDSRSAYSGSTAKLDSRGLTKKINHRGSESAEVKIFSELLTI